MKKKQLLALPVDPLVTNIDYPDVTKKKLKNYYGTSYVETTSHYTYRAFWDMSTGEKVLVVDIFTSGTKAHVYRNFTGPDGFFGYNYREQKISSAGMDYVITGVLGYRCEYHATDEETEKTIKELTGEQVTRNTGYYVSGNNAISLLGRYHGKMKDDKLQRRYQKIKDSISREMIEIREELPKPVMNWITNTLMKDSRYIFYQYNGKKQTTGICSHCHAEVSITKPKKGEKGTCPNCHSRITYLPKKQWKATNGFSDDKRFCYFQPTKKGFCARYYRAIKIYWNECNLGKLQLHEETRIFYEKSLGDYFKPVSRYDWGEFRQTGTHCFNTNPSYYTLNETKITNICPVGLNKILRTDHDKRKYIDFAEIAKKCGEINSRHISDFPAGYPQIEYLMKLRLYKIAAGIINGQNTDGVIDTAENNIKKALGIGKDDIPVLQKLNPDFRTLRLYKIIKQREGKADVQTLKWLGEMLRNEQDLARVLRIAPVTVSKVVRYLKEQEPFFEKGYWGKSRAEEALSFWKDYLKNCVTLQYDLKNSFILFPKDLHRAHDEAMAAVEEQAKKEEHTLIEAMEERLNKEYYFENKRFFIRAPHNGKEIRDEGNALHHCVGRYVRTMAEGDTIILFVRDKEQPDKPYYTVELNPDTLQIIQYRGYGNNVSKEHPVDPEVTKFLKQWEEKKLNKLKVLSA